MKIDFSLRSVRLVLMRRVGSIIVFLLVTLWLPATLRCELVAAGLLQPTVAQDGSTCNCPPGSPCSKDGCQNLELNLPAPISDQPDVVVPEAVLCTCHICCRCLDLCPTMIATAKPWFFVEPFELARPWQFERRAAPAPRSPSLA
jgi:hypothetical protein